MGLFHGSASTTSISVVRAVHAVRAAGRSVRLRGFPRGSADEAGEGERAAVRGPGDVGGDRRRVGQGNGGVFVPQPGAGRFGYDGQRASEGDELGELRVVADLWARAGRVDAAAWPARD